MPRGARASLLICRAAGKVYGGRDGRQGVVSTFPPCVLVLLGTLHHVFWVLRVCAEEFCGGFGSWVLSYEYFIIIQLFKLTASCKVSHSIRKTNYLAIFRAILLKGNNKGLGTKVCLQISVYTSVYHTITLFIKHRFEKIL